MIEWLKSLFRRRKTQPVIIGRQPPTNGAYPARYPPMPPRLSSGHTPPRPVPAPAPAPATATAHTPLLGRMVSQPYPDPDRVQVARAVTVDDIYRGLLATRLACTDDKPFPSSSYSCSGGYDSSSSSSDSCSSSSSSSCD